MGTGEQSLFRFGTATRGTEVYGPFRRCAVPAGDLPVPASSFSWPGSGATNRTARPSRLDRGGDPDRASERGRGGGERGELGERPPAGGADSCPAGAECHRRVVVRRHRVDAARWDLRTAG